MAEPETTALNELDKLFVTLIEGAKEKGPKVVDWLYAEVPEVVEQLLLWHFAQSLVTFLVCFFFIFIFPFVLLKVAYHLHAKLEVNKFKDKFNFFFPAVLCFVILNIPAQIASWEAINLTWLKITLAPKVYLMEYVSSLIK